MKDLDYQPDWLQADQPQPDQLQPDQLVLVKWVKMVKNRFNVIQNIVTEAKSNKWGTNVD